MTTNAVKQWQFLAMDPGYERVLFDSPRTERVSSWLIRQKPATGS
jgi:hypothetical protein